MREGKPLWQNFHFWVHCPLFCHMSLCLPQCVCETGFRPALFQMYAETRDAGAPERVWGWREAHRRLQHLHKPHQLHNLVQICPGETQQMVFCVLDSSPSSLHIDWYLSSHSLICPSLFLLPRSLPWVQVSSRGVESSVLQSLRPREISSPTT